MLKLLSPIDYCQGIRRERGTLLLVLFFVKHEIYADIDVPLKYHDERLTLDVVAERRSADSNPRQSVLLYWIPRLNEDFAQFCLSGSPGRLSWLPLYVGSRAVLKSRRYTSCLYESPALRLISASALLNMSSQSLLRQSGALGLLVY